MLKRTYDDIIHKYYKKFYGEIMLEEGQELTYIECRDFLTNELIPLLRNNYERLNKRQLEELRFIIANNFNVLNENRYPIIEKDVKANKFVVIADTHFGSDEENYEYIYRVFDFCDKNNIKNVFHAGDFIEGTYQEDPYLNYENREDLIEEIYNAIERYPKSDITTHLILGNHDVNSYNNSFNVCSNNKNNRYLQVYRNNSKNIELDGVSIIKYNLVDDNETILTSFNLEHYICNRFKTERPQGLILHGHEHHFLPNYAKKKLSEVYLPPLCDKLKDDSKINKIKEIVKPGFLIGEIISGKLFFTPCFFNDDLDIEINDKAKVYRFLKS